MGFRKSSCSRYESSGVPSASVAPSASFSRAIAPPPSASASGARTARQARVTAPHLSASQSAAPQALPAHRASQWRAAASQPRSPGPAVGDAFSAGAVTVPRYPHGLRQRGAAAPSPAPNAQGRQRNGAVPQCPGCALQRAAPCRIPARKRIFSPPFFLSSQGIYFPLQGCAAAFTSGERRPLPCPF